MNMIQLCNMQENTHMTSMMPNQNPYIEAYDSYNQTLHLGWNSKLNIMHMP